MTFYSLLALLFSWLITAVACGLVCSLLYPLAKRLFSRTDVKVTPRLLFLYAITPVICASISVAIYHFPVVAGAIVGQHCHHGQCTPHSIYLPLTNKFGMGLLVSGLLLSCMLFAILLRQVVNHRRFSRTVNAVGTPSESKYYRIVESTDPGAWCVGLVSPVIYLTRGLLQRSSDEEVSVILSHEICHAKHLDNLKRLISAWATLFWLPATRKQLLTDLKNSNEIRCDAYALSRSKADSPVDVLSKACNRFDGSELHWQARNGWRSENLTDEAQPLGQFTCIVLYLAYVMMLVTVIVHFGHPGIEWMMQ